MAASAGGFREVWNAEAAEPVHEAVATPPCRTRFYERKFLNATARSEDTKASVVEECERYGVCPNETNGCGSFDAACWERSGMGSASLTASGIFRMFLTCQCSLSNSNSLSYSTLMTASIAHRMI
jgi:hypothetical protein